MIQVNELRIGNFVQFKEDANIIQVIEIFKVHPFPDYFIEWVPAVEPEETDNFEEDNDIENGHSLINSIEPTLLSAAVLEKCGFEIESELDEWINYHLPAYLAPNNKAFFNKQSGVFKINKIAKDILYLHDLQNLYFCLSGTELPIKF